MWGKVGEAGIWDRKGAVSIFFGRNFYNNVEGEVPSPPSPLRGQGFLVPQIGCKWGNGVSLFLKTVQLFFPHSILYLFLFHPCYIVIFQNQNLFHPFSSLIKHPNDKKPLPNPYLTTPSLLLQKTQT